jgi:NAD-dependent DNA ligase
LFENKIIKDAADIYALTENDILSLDGYKERSAKNVIDAIKKELNLSKDVPVIIGELGEFVGGYNNGKCKYFNSINNILSKLSEEYGVFVSAKGLTCKNDGIHFNSKSYREFGKRYFNAYLQTVEKREQDGFIKQAESLI